MSMSRGQPSDPSASEALALQVLNPPSPDTKAKAAAAAAAEAPATSPSRALLHRDVQQGCGGHFWPFGGG